MNKEQKKKTKGEELADLCERDGVICCPNCNTELIRYSTKTWKPKFYYQF
jgi:hypothetical protein